MPTTDLVDLPGGWEWHEAAPVAIERNHAGDICTEVALAGDAGEPSLWLFVGHRVPLSVLRALLQRNIDDKANSATD